MKPLLQELQALEVELHHPGVRCSRDRLNQLLHPEFHEVGRSGRSHTRETIVNLLVTQESQPVVASEAFSVAELGPEVALLTYRSAHLKHGNILMNHTLRSFVWVKTNAGWQLRYHQAPQQQRFGDTTRTRQHLIPRVKRCAKIATYARSRPTAMRPTVPPAITKWSIFTQSESRGMSP